MECGSPFEEAGHGKFQASQGRPYSESPNRQPAPRGYSSERYSTEEQPVMYADSTLAAEVPTRYRQQPNPMLEQLKATVEEYGQYFVKYLKKPTAVFQNPHAEYLNGLTTFLLFVMFTGIGYFSLKPPGKSFFPFVGETFLYFAVHAAIIVVSLYTVSRFFGPELSLKKFIGIYGTHLIPTLIIGAAANLLIQFDLPAYGTVLLSLSATYYALYILPLYLIVKMVATRSALIDPLYAYLSFITMAGILHALFLSFAAEKKLALFIQSLSFL
ncbi:hypothetical protein ACFOZY_09100 [Chungangia koreensis]|uniref:Yip1 domain-containing protein n=1 Tax=Chungangia koreensis TaxID=752657 RepID=A0ABV8X3S4_9LACT